MAISLNDHESRIKALENIKSSPKISLLDKLKPTVNYQTYNISNGLSHYTCLIGVFIQNTSSKLVWTPHLLLPAETGFTHMCHGTDWSIVVELISNTQFKYYSERNDSCDFYLYGLKL